MKKIYIQPNTMCSSIDEEASLLEISASGIDNPPTPGTDPAPSGPCAKDNYIPKNYNIWDD